MTETLKVLRWMFYLTLINNKTLLPSAVRNGLHSGKFFFKFFFFLKSWVLVSENKIFWFSDLSSFVLQLENTCCGSILWDLIENFVFKLDLSQVSQALGPASRVPLSRPQVFLHTLILHFLVFNFNLKSFEW